MSATQDRPVFLTLLRIRQPVAAVVSILHRLTGFFMVLLLPGLIYLLQLSLSSVDGYSQAIAFMDKASIRYIGLVVCWVFAHHLLAGVRFLLLDFDVGITRNSSRKTAWLVHIGAVLITLIAASRIL